MYAIGRYDLRLQISDYKYRNLLFCLRFPAVFCRMAAVLAFHPAIRLFKKQAVIDYAAYRAFHVIGKLMGRNVQLLRQNLAVTGSLVQHIHEV